MSGSVDAAVDGVEPNLMPVKARPENSMFHRAFFRLRDDFSLTLSSSNVRHATRTTERRLADASTIVSCSFATVLCWYAFSSISSPFLANTTPDTLDDVASANPVDNDSEPMMTLVPFT